MDHMDFALTFARHFSRLVWLLLHESRSIDEQKAALRAVITVAKEGSVALATQEWRLVVNGTPLPEALTGVQDLAAQLIGHAVKELRFDQGATPADVLGVARILATEPVPGDGGDNVKAKMGALGAQTAHVDVWGMSALKQKEKPEAELPVQPAVPTPETTAAVPADATPADGAAALTVTGSLPVHVKGTVDDLLQQLDASTAPTATTRVLDELVTLAETSQREGKAEIVCDAFYGIVKREVAIPDNERKRAYIMAVRRLSKPTILRVVAQMMARRAERQEPLTLVLSRTGEDGADALIEQLTAATSMHERRTFFDALVKLKSGVSALIHMLGDPRWYVARNAADLLGEMQAPEAETPLTELLKHDDDRVRRAAATALAKLGTPKAVTALHGALRDSSPQVRVQAAAGLATRKGQKSASTLSKALDEESDPEVQLAIIAALGRLGTPDAVTKLVKAAEPDGRLFKKKPVAYRVAAVQALGEARTAAARSALQSLIEDKDKEVKAAVWRVVMGAQRDTGAVPGEKTQA
jgi:HEAT repeat protein